MTTGGRQRGADPTQRHVVIDRDVVSALTAHCIAGYPEEACGLLAATSTLALIDRWYPTRNAAASARRYLVDPTDQLHADRAAENEGRSIVGVFHSHTHTDAFPSPTDVAEAPDPTWFYVVVSLRGETPTLRSYRIADGSIVEDNVETLADSRL
jgi:[CysO sulfur-carrier protein]-S-L-cysteine hydrolase